MTFKHSCVLDLKGSIISVSAPTQQHVSIREPLNQSPGTMQAMTMLERYMVQL